MEFLIFMISVGMVFIMLFYYMNVFHKISDSKSSAQVLVLLIIPIFGIIIVHAMQRIDEIEKEKK